jgi:hypothetical protein
MVGQVTGRCRQHRLVLTAIGGSTRTAHGDPTLVELDGLRRSEPAPPCRAVKLRSLSANLPSIRFWPKRVWHCNGCGPQPRRTANSSHRQTSLLSTGRPGRVSVLQCRLADGEVCAGLPALEHDRWARTMDSSRRHNPWHLWRGRETFPAAQTEAVGKRKPAQRDPVRLYEGHKRRRCRRYD